jgi:two-component system, NtrC family, sensor kinase
LRRLLVFTLAVLLTALLAFLVYMTQSVDFGRQVRVNAVLGDLRELDASWNESVLRSRTEFLADPEMLRVSRDRLGRAINELGEQARALDDPVLVANVAQLSTLYDQKLDLIARYREAAGLSNTALRGVLQSVTAAQARLRDFEVGATTLAGQRIDEVRRLLDRLSTKSMEFSVVSAGRLTQEIEEAEFKLVAAMEVLPATYREPLQQTVEHLRSLRSVQPAREQFFSKVYYYPTGPRTDALGQLFETSFQAAIEQRELYRVYLVFYSAALLVVLAYIGSQLLRSYRIINGINLQLKRSNDTLEQKVELRTRELSEALAHLKESEAMLVQSEKMSSLGQMVAGVAHEINTPLAYVKASLEAVQSQLPMISSLSTDTSRLLALLQSGDADENAVNAQFTRVSAVAAELHSAEAIPTLGRLVDDGLYGIGQISDIVVNLKDFARLDRNKISRVDLHDCLESTLKIARNVVKTKSVVKRFGTIPPVSCSPSQLNQVFLNLITNAAQATPETGGTIVITTRMVGEREVAVDIDDNGHGIPADVLPRIFDPFFTTKEVGKGTGLGLSIAFKIVQQHGGRIVVDSKTGQGTRFSVILPLEISAAAAA